jgi:hypothetical protein
LLRVKTISRLHQKVNRYGYKKLHTFAAMKTELTPIAKIKPLQIEG